MTCGVFSLSLFALVVLIPGSATAQWGRHFTAAVGPSVGIDGTPPHVGVHVRISGALAPGPRVLNLLADGYVTWMAPGTREDVFFDGSSFFIRDQENQVGLGVNGMVNFSPRGSVSPYLLVGAVTRWSDANRRFELRDASGQITDQSRISQTEHQFDILLGLGTAFSWGARRLLLEARLYGGMAINMPITIGLTL
jgi:hypothetical protein